MKKDDNFRIIRFDSKKLFSFELIEILKLVSLVLATHFMLLLNRFYIPFELLYGPLLFMAVKRLNNYDNSKTNMGIKKAEWLHFLPFIVSIGIHIFFRKHIEGILIAATFSLLIYSLLIFVAIRDQDKAHESIRLINFLAFFMLTAAVLLLLLVVEDRHAPILGFNTHLFILGILFISFALSVYFIMSRFFIIKQQAVDKNLIEGEEPSKSSDEDNMDIADKIILYFEYSTAYLDAGFTVEQLALDIELSKEDISRVINRNLEKNFYQLLAEYRIYKAKELLLYDDNYTIETLMYECGFNSKTSFNKYFKQFVGITPSQYREKNLICT